MVDLSKDSPAGSAVKAVTGSAVTATPRARRILDVAKGGVSEGTPETVKLTRAGGLDSPGRAKGSSPAADSRSTDMQRFRFAVVHTRHREAYTIVLGGVHHRKLVEFISPRQSILWFPAWFCYCL